MGFFKAVEARDTDADWRRIGESEPHWGVLTAPEFRQARLDPANLEEFYATGQRHIADVAMQFSQIFGVAFHASKAFDFGCGVGRLTEAMAAYADHVIGYDISPGMLAAARQHGTAGRYTDELPDGPFGWINSYIVFQHIPASRGMQLLDQLMARLAPGGFVSLHFTIYREPRDHHVWVERGKLRHLPRPLQRLVRQQIKRFAKQPPLGTVLMYDYDLTRIIEVLHRAGIGRTLLVHDNHGGHHGVKIFGRRAELPR